jgi:hypothetical protein
MSAKKKSKLISPEILPAGSTETVSVLPDPKAVAAAILADRLEGERYARASVFAVMRAGLQLLLIRDTNAYGGLAKFFREHKEALGGKTERTWYNHLRIAYNFAVDAGLTDHKTTKLTNGEKIAPIIAATLASITEGKHTGVIGQMVKWVNDRTITQLYNDLSHEPPPTPPSPKAGRKNKETDERAEQLADALNGRAALVCFRELKHWRHFNEVEMTVLQKELLGFLKDTIARNAEARSAQPQKWSAEPLADIARELDALLKAVGEMQKQHGRKKS